jgi:hypothetical protein
MKGTVRLLATALEQIMATTTTRPDYQAPTPPAKVEDNTLDEQHAGLGERTFPVTDNDQSAESGQSHAADADAEERQRRIAVKAYLRAERRGFNPGAELDDWLEAEKEEDHFGEPGPVS